MWERTAKYGAAKKPNKTRTENMCSRCLRSGSSCVALGTEGAGKW